MAKETKQAAPRRAVLKENTDAGQTQSGPTAKELAQFDEVLPNAVEAIKAGTMNLEGAVVEITSRLTSLNPDDVKAKLEEALADPNGDEPGAQADANSGTDSSPSTATEKDKPAAPAPAKLAKPTPDDDHMAKRRTKALREAGAALDEDLELVIVEVPKAFKLRVTNDLVIDVKSGAQKIERFVAKHWYAKAYGVKVVE